MDGRILTASVSMSWAGWGKTGSLVSNNQKAAHWSPLEQQLSRPNGPQYLLCLLSILRGKRRTFEHGEKREPSQIIMIEGKRLQNRVVPADVISWHYYKQL
jgi:hypothetical protein